MPAAVAGLTTLALDLWSLDREVKQLWIDSGSGMTAATLAVGLFVLQVLSTDTNSVTAAKIITDRPVVSSCQRPIPWIHIVDLASSRNIADGTREPSRSLRASFSAARDWWIGHLTHHTATLGDHDWKQLLPCDMEGYRCRWHAPVVGASFGSTPATVYQASALLMSKHNLLADPIYMSKLILTMLHHNRRLPDLHEVMLMHSGGAQSIAGFIPQLTTASAKAKDCNSIFHLLETAFGDSGGL